MKLALISDIHGNLEALNSVLREIKKRKIKNIYCLGDIIDYGANSNECVEVIRKNKIPAIMGNHDFTAVTLEGIEWFNTIAQKSCRITNKLLSERNKKFLLNLPKKIEIRNMFLAHGSPKDYLHEYIYPEEADYIFREFFKITKKQIIAMGHTHIPFIKKFDDKLAINPGSVGQPRDGNNKASFCILDNKKLKAEIIRVDYDIKKAADKIKEIGMPKILANRLFEGV